MTANTTKPPIIVKLGGSTSHGQSYKQWLKQLELSATPIVIVPGGGPFADAIRTTQTSLDFNDTTAHDLALLSMNQFGRVLLQHLPTAVALHRAAHGHTIVDSLSVWLPDPDELRDHAAIEQSWRTSGDTLACWLCTQLGARDLILIKSVKQARLQQSLTELCQQNIIDPLCEQWVIKHRLNIRLLGVDNTDGLQPLLS